MSGLSIWKYALRIEDWQVLEMPFGWKRVALQEQGGFPTLWALVDPEAVRVSTPILCFGTGQGVPVRPGEPLGTVQINRMVWHYFREGARAGVPARELLHGEVDLDDPTRVAPPKLAPDQIAAVLRGETPEGVTPEQVLDVHAHFGGGQ